MISPGTKFKNDPKYPFFLSTYPSPPFYGLPLTLLVHTRPKDVWKLRAFHVAAAGVTLQFS